MSRTLDYTLSSEELFLEQAFALSQRIQWLRQISLYAFRHCCQSFFRTPKKVHVNKHGWYAHWLVDWLLRIRAWQLSSVTISQSCSTLESIFMGLCESPIMHLSLPIADEKRSGFAKTNTENTQVWL